MHAPSFSVLLTFATTLAETPAASNLAFGDFVKLDSSLAVLVGGGAGALVQYLRRKFAGLTDTVTHLEQRMIALETTLAAVNQSLRERIDQEAHK